MNARPITKVLLLAVIASTIGCDQVSKHMAAERLSGVPRQSFLGDFFRLELAHNTGAFLSIGASLPTWARTAVFSGGTALLLAACVFAALRRRWTRAQLLGFALVIAGGLSNLVDRIAHGAVVDFLNVGIGPVRTGIFNVADMAILLGIALLAFAGERRSAASEPT